MGSEKLNGQPRVTQHIHFIIQAVDSKPQLLPLPSLCVSLGPEAADAVGSTSRSLFSGSPVVGGPSQLSEGPSLFCVLIVLELSVRVVLTGNYLADVGA